jgi:hypothetical protein
MDLRERIKKDFDSLAARSMEVPEWGEDGQPLVVQTKPMTLEEFSQITKYAGDNEALMCVYTVIFMALDADGNRLFKLADKSFLMKGANPAVVGRLSRWILSDAGSAATAAEK